MKQNQLSPQGADPINEVAVSTVSTRRRVDDLAGPRPARRRRRKSTGKAIVATLSVAAIAAVATFWPGESPHIPAAPMVDHGMTSDQLLEDLVNRGLVPVKAIEPPEDALMLDLVNRGLIPRQALGD